ncbi:MAG: ABC transporter substrate-binding protein [Planctomycetota bacterium]|nr:ABC transporter substrate-binding protein [Planctomycetota bacterium]
MPGFFALFLLAAIRLSPAGEMLRLRLGLSRAPSALPVLRLIESGALADMAEIETDLWTGPEQLLALVQGGEHQLFTLPLTLAARLLAKGVKLRLTNVNTWGGIALLATDPGIGGWTDLRGKTVYAPSPASPPGTLLRHFLGRAGLTPGRDVEIVTAAAAETTQLLSLGRIGLAVLLEPQITAALAGNPALRVVADFEDEWRRERGAGADLPSLGFGGLAAFIDAKPEFVRRFEEEYAAALAWTLAHPAEAGRLAARHLGLRGDLVEMAVPRLGLRYRTAADAAGEVNAYLRILGVPADPSGGGGMPDEAFYRR